MTVFNMTPVSVNVKPVGSLLSTATPAQILKLKDVGVTQKLKDNGQYYGYDDLKGMNDVAVLAVLKNKPYVVLEKNEGEFSIDFECASKVVSFPLKTNELHHLDDVVKLCESSIKINAFAYESLLIAMNKAVEEAKAKDSALSEVEFKQKYVTKGSGGLSTLNKEYLDALVKENQYLGASDRTSAVAQLREHKVDKIVWEEKAKNEIGLKRFAVFKDLEQYPVEFAINLTDTYFHDRLMEAKGYAEQLKAYQNKSQTEADTKEKVESV